MKYIIETKKLILKEISNGYFYLKGFGHDKEYFIKNPKNSYIELLANYSVLIAYNDTMLIKVMQHIMGYDMCNILNLTLNSILGNNNISPKGK